MKTLKEAIKEAEQKHFVIFHYPRLKKVRISGGKLLSETEALKYICEVLLPMKNDFSV